MKQIRLLTLLIVFCSLKSYAINVQYTLSFPAPQTHYAEVEMKVYDWKGGAMDLRMPVWAPGSYLVREFSRYLENFSATDATGRKLEYKRISKNGWGFLAPKGTVTIRYSVYAYELTVRTSFIDADHAYLNGTSIFLYEMSGKQWPITVKVNPFESWKTISVALENKGNNTFSAEDYDLLADSPFEIGNHTVFRFVSSGIPHEVAMFGQGNYDTTRLQTDMKRITEECASVFGSHPCKSYLFIVHNLNSGGGGLEHLNSTTLQTSRWSYGTESSYTGFLSLVAHEYFHLWNVKRLRPYALGPFDYNNENYTTMLWFSEGFTAYYDDLIVRRCGYTSPDSYLSSLAGNMSYVTNTPGTKVQSLEESSYDAWIKFYRPSENSANNSVSYYTKGATVGAMLNFAILQSTSGKKSLDDLMRLLYQRFYIDNKGKAGFTENDFKKTLTEVAGKNMDDFFANYIAGTEAIPYTDFISAVGLKLSDLNAKAKTVWIGASTSVKENKLLVTAIERDGPAWAGGLNVNDEVLAINQYRVGDDFSKTLNLFKAGDMIALTVSRSGLIRTLNLTTAATPSVKYLLEPKADADMQVKENFKSWLRLK